MHLAWQHCLWPSTPSRKTSTILLCWQLPLYVQGCPAFSDLATCSSFWIVLMCITFRVLANISKQEVLHTSVALSSTRSSGPKKSIKAFLTILETHIKSFMCVWCLVHYSTGSARSEYSTRDYFTHAQLISENFKTLKVILSKTR